MSCSTDKLIVSLIVCFSTANITDNQMYESLAKSLADLLENIIVYQAYNDGKSYQYSKENSLRLIFR